MSLGKVGAINAAKMGGILSIVLLTTYRVADYFLTDKSTLTKLVGYLAVDIVKVGIATGVSIAFATGVAAVTTVAIGPILAVLIVGLVVTTALNFIDERYGIADLVVAGLDELNNSASSYIDDFKNEVRQIKNNAIDSVIDYFIESAHRIVINFSRHHLRKFTSSTPRFR